jgi:hypothetical protein
VNENLSESTFARETYERLFTKFNKYTLNKKECANELGISTRAFSQLVQKGKLELEVPPCKHGQKIYIPLKKFAEAIAKLRG